MGALPGQAGQERNASDGLTLSGIVRRLSETKSLAIIALTFRQ